MPTAEHIHICTLTPKESLQPQDAIRIDAGLHCLLHGFLTQTHLCIESGHLCLPVMLMHLDTGGWNLGKYKTATLYTFAACTRAQSLTRPCPCATYIWLLHPGMPTCAKDGLGPL